MRDSFESTCRQHSLFEMELVEIDMFQINWFKLIFLQIDNLVCLI